jgi:hypothetical protein
MVVFGIGTPDVKQLARRKLIEGFGRLSLTLIWNAIAAKCVAFDH